MEAKEDADVERGGQEKREESEEREESDASELLVCNFDRSTTKRYWLCFSNRQL